MKFSENHPILSLQKNPQNEYECGQMNHSDHFYLALRIIASILNRVQQNQSDSTYERLFNFFHPEWTNILFGRPEDWNTHTYFQKKLEILQTFHSNLFETFSHSFPSLKSCILLLFKRKLISIYFQTKLWYFLWKILIDYWD